MRKRERLARRTGSLAFLFAPVLAAAFFAAPAGAQERTTTRDTYFAGDPSLPELAGDYLRAHPNEGLEILTVTRSGREPVEIYHALGPVARSSQGVCRFTTTQIFPHRSAGGTVSWDRTPPRPGESVEPPFSLAAMGTPLCPSRSMTAYTALDSGITDEEFVTILAFWREVSGSEAKFDEASILLPLIISPRAAQRFSAFRDAVLAPGSSVQLRAIFRAGVDAYELSFAGAASEPPNFFLSVQKGATGFQAVQFQSRF